MEGGKDLGGVMKTKLIGIYCMKEIFSVKNTKKLVYYRFFFTSLTEQPFYFDNYILYISRELNIPIHAYNIGLSS